MHPRPNSQHVCGVMGGWASLARACSQCLIYVSILEFKCKQWIDKFSCLRIANFLPGKPTDKDGPSTDNRLFVKAILYLAHIGSPWRDLPKDFATGTQCMFNLHVEKIRVFGIALLKLYKAIPTIHLCNDCSCPPAWNRSPKNSANQAIGCSWGGLSTKIHACIDALCKQICLILTPGQLADVTQGAALIETILTDAVIVDKGYDCDQVIKAI